ncbi:DUF6438 domain-containing protein [Hydrocarboniphaga sp.]|uniref:DUF6438 domain-containing protein n=1 Tax=Hydrocarboniphaga sp. TaxID=2033016 RepID=UPI003D149FAD
MATSMPGDVVDTSSKPLEESTTFHAVRVDEMATDELIRMSRSGCGWACPAYTLSFFRDGTIVFNGRSHTAVSGEQRSRISEAAVADLLRELQQQLPGLAKRYTPDSKDCGPMFTDQATTKLSARLQQGLVTAERYGGCPAAPKTLAALEKKADAVAGSDLWVSNRPAY